MTVSADISSSRVSDLIGTIYQCARDPSGWTNVLDQLRKALNFRFARMDESNPALDELAISATSGLTPEWTHRMESDLAADIVATWRGKELVLDDYMGDDLHLLSRRNPPVLHPVRGQRYAWRELAGLGDAIAIPLSRKGNRIGALGLSKPWGAGVVTPSEVELVRLFVPHFRQAIAMQAEIERNAVAAATFDSVLNKLQFAVVLVDHELRIIHANQTAELMFVARMPFRIHGDKLRLWTAADTRLLAEAVCNKTAHAFCIPMTRQWGAARLLHAIPLGVNRSRCAYSPYATTALFVAPEMATEPALEVMRLLFELTAAETIVLEHIVVGRNVRETAKVLGVSVNTVKTHLRRLFDKTGTHRQAELITLISSHSLPVRQ